MKSQTIFVGGPLHGKPTEFDSLAIVETPTEVEGHSYTLRGVVEVVPTPDPEVGLGRTWYVFADESATAEQALDALAEARIEPYETQNVFVPMWKT